MKNLLVLMLISLAVFSCKKDEQNDLPVTTQQEFSFAATLIDHGSGLKSNSDWDCKPYEPDYAQVTIDGIDYFPLVYRIDGRLYTQSIKLDVTDGVSKTYTVSKFLLWYDGNTPGDMTDDEIVMGTPTDASDYKLYVQWPVDFTITVTAFQKLEVDIEVLCFQDDEYTHFGFDWFIITEIVIREQCFFGDICLKHLADYAGSNYENQANGIQLDLPALFKIHAFKDGVEVPFSPFTNMLPYYDPPTNSIPWWGEGNPLCVRYPDNLNVTGEEFTFELWIYVKMGAGFDYKLFHTWTFMDDAVIPDGDDGIVEFVLGECNFSSTDLQLAAYQHLPTTASITITHPGDPGYWDLIVNSVTPDPTPAVFDLVTGSHTGWCGDHNTTIGQGTHTFYIYSSLYDIDWPAGMPYNLQTIAKVNWIINHLDWYGMDINALTDPDGDIIQDAIWKLINNISCSGTAATMVADASTHGDYVPLPGGWAAILMVKDNNPQDNQLIFTMVDP